MRERAPLPVEQSGWRAPCGETQGIRQLSFAEQASGNSVTRVLGRACMTFIIFGLVLSLLAVLVIGFVMVYQWITGIYGRAQRKAEAAKKEEMRRWAEQQPRLKGEDEETWHQNQEMKMD